MEQEKKKLDYDAKFHKTPPDEKYLLCAVKSGQFIVKMRKDESEYRNNYILFGKGDYYLGYNMAEVCNKLYKPRKKQTKTINGFAKLIQQDIPEGKENQNTIAEIRRYLAYCPIFLNGQKLNPEIRGSDDSSFWVTGRHEYTMPCYFNIYHIYLCHIILTIII